MAAIYHQQPAIDQQMMGIAIAAVLHCEVVQTWLYALQKTVHMLVFNILVSPKQLMHNGLFAETT